MNNGYQQFSFYYDLLNRDVDYSVIGQFIHSQLLQHNINSGIIADLGCGTGELTLFFARLGYDMIGIDISQDMLSITQQKVLDEKVKNILLLNQSLHQIDLYGTINACFSTFDTLNHIGPSNYFESTISRIALFLEPGGLFIFDVNSLYKHSHTLGNNTFYIDDDDITLKWTNEWDNEQKTTKISLSLYNDNIAKAQESFYEYFYTPEYIKNVLLQNHIFILECIDGDSFGPITETTERYLFITQRSN